ncbi:GAL3ST1 [Branchiostoma lanceolatum]|uniref:GAL3ST1 protein n=3 Tax=Branchiostoma lanceolatum TaxID=7740 RepID=A0A8J9ZJZ7_BRALA|nr:GAL3ST1 [Branchiostoma lanceolatum]
MAHTHQHRPTLEEDGPPVSMIQLPQAVRAKLPAITLPRLSTHPLGTMRRSRLRIMLIALLWLVFLSAINWVITSQVMKRSQGSSTHIVQGQGAGPLAPKNLDPNQQNLHLQDDKIQDQVENEELDDEFLKSQEEEDVEDDNQEEPEKFMADDEQSDQRGQNGLAMEGGGDCERKNNFVFIKVHKAGSTTTMGIFLRYGYEHNLTFVLPRKTPSLGWPAQLNEDFYIPLKNNAFNILTHHTVYNRDLIGNIMPKDSSYLAILRHPINILKSVFNWCSLGDRLSIKADNPVAYFLEHLDNYAKQLEKVDSPVSLRNFMSFEFGYKSLHAPPSEDEMETFVEAIEKEFNLVMILEHFDESLVLLRRVMCWDMKDILYLTKNAESYDYRRAQISSEEVRMHRQMSKMDYALFEHFNATLWAKIEQQGSNFRDELEHFKTVNGQVKKYCESRDHNEPLKISTTKWYSAFSVDKEFCKNLIKPQKAYDKELKARQEPLYTDNYWDTKDEVAARWAKPKLPC